MSLVTYPFGILLTFLAYGVVTVFGTALYEPAYGRFGSLQVIAMFGAAASLIAVVPFGLAAALFRRALSPGRSFILGSACAAVLLAMAAGVQAFSPNTAIPLAWTGSALVVLAAASALLTKPAVAP